jgi:AraC-like DNA-binding protein
MADDILRIKTITQLHELLGFEKPKHPLISVMNVEDLKNVSGMSGLRTSADFYLISLKEHDCGMTYGRGHYDFEEGTMIFTAPNQVIQTDENQDHSNDEGWMLFFHPDLIRSTTLGEKIDTYSFFSYEANEALHLSDQEKKIIYDCVKNIELEYNTNIDEHSQDLFISNLELMLNYCRRFYNRQFHTRTSQQKDVVSQFEKHVKEYFQSDDLSSLGQPSVQYFAELAHLSPNYLSDLLKKETGRNIKEHINDTIVHRAKTMLLNSSNSVSEIAYDLGFNYPHYFSRMFKSQTGFSPAKYRESIN